MLRRNVRIAGCGGVVPAAVLRAVAVTFCCCGGVGLAQGNSVNSVNSVDSVSLIPPTNVVFAASASNLIDTVSATNVVTAAAIETNLIAQATDASDRRGGEEEALLSGAIDLKQAEAEEARSSWFWEPGKWPSLPVVFYLSLRGHLLNYQGETVLADGGSRAGVMWDHELESGHRLYARGEVGFDVFDSFKYVVTPDASSADGSSGNLLNPRLYYAGIRRDEWRAQLGKTWSSYYNVAGITDSFVVFGGRCAGVYNSRTDGGGSGTGRADHALLMHQSRGPVKVGLQGQIDTEIPTFVDEKYAYGAGGYFAYALPENLTFGAAYNRAFPDQISEEMRAKGFDGDDQALALGGKWAHGRWVFSTVTAWTQNHDSDDADVFFDAFGWETYGRCTIADPLRVVAGWGLQVPRDGSDATAFRRHEYVFGVQFAFKALTFNDMVYLEYNVDQGRSADGGGRHNALALGGRIRFSW